MSEIVDIAYKFGCGRYICGFDVLETVGNQVSRAAKRVFVVGGKTALSLTRERLIRGFDEAGIEYVFEEYNGFCAHKAAREYAEKALELGADAIIGVGGGRAMDFSKLCGVYAKLPTYTVPTSLSTCAAFTTLSVIYDESGKTVGNYYLEEEVRGIFVDYGIMINQPVRLVAAGIMDALAKHIEIKNGHREVDTESFNIDLVTASVLAKHTYETILANREEACGCIERHEFSKAVENIIFACLPVTGMISGISKGFGQSALGHELYYQLRTKFTKEALSYLHGEVVAIGLLTQLVYNTEDELVAPFAEMMSEMGMPTTLEKIGIERTKENFDLLYKEMCRSDFVRDEKLFEKALKVIFNTNTEE